MANTITKKQRAEVEELIYKFFDAVDKSHTNSDYYKKLFADMSDEQFLKMMKAKFPFKLHYRPSVVEPTMKDAENGLKVLGVPMLEKINMAFLYNVLKRLRNRAGDNISASSPNLKK